MPPYAPPLDQPKALGSDELGDQSILGRHFSQVRSIVELPWDKEIDFGYPVECFFQMPTGTVSIKSAKVWCSQLPFRQYNSAGAAGGGSTTTSQGSSATSSSGGNSAIGGATPSNSGGDTGHSHDSHSGSGSGSSGGDATGSSAFTTDNQGSHNHSCGAQTDSSYASHDHNTGFPSGFTTSHTHLTSNDGVHAHNCNSHSHSHSHTISVSVSVFPATHTSYQHTHTIGHSHSDTGHTHPIPHTHDLILAAHTHTLTAGIIETPAVGTLSLFVADDGVTFGTAITSGVSGTNAMVGVSITPQLTIAAGNKRLRFTSGGLGRVQVFLVLDLVIGLPGTGG